MHNCIQGSGKTDYETPQEFFDELDREFGFDLDVCATAENAKHERFFSPEQDGLKQDWQGTCWMNPPYGLGIQRWVRKAYEASLNGATVVCLLPASTDTRWWHEYVMKGEIRFVQRRLSFGTGRAPFPSVIVIFRYKTE